MVKKDDKELAELFLPIIESKVFSTVLEMTKLQKIVSLIKERADFVNEFWDLSDYFFVAPISYDEKAAKNWKEETPELMKQLIIVLNTIEDFTSINIETIVKEIGRAHV